MTQLCHFVAYYEHLAFFCLDTCTSMFNAALVITKK